MGQYTEYWSRYTKENARRTLQLLGVVAFLPVIALGGYGLSQITTRAVPVVIGALAIWLVIVTVFAVRSSKVQCPRCSTAYSRGKFLSNCPQCGLRMLQEDP